MIYELGNQIESYFNLGLCLKGGNNAVVEEYLQSRIITLCHDLGIANYQLQELPFENIFTDIEFNKIVPDENEQSFINKHFYRKLFRDLKKIKTTDEERRRDFWILDFKPKYCFTLDRTLTPQISASNVNYGILKLGNKPIFYYILIDVNSIINLIKKI
jgi:hypothetical protein